MNQFLKKSLQGDKVVWFVFVTLIIISVIELFSASSSLVYRFGSIQAPILRHVKFIIGGLCFALFIQVLSIKQIRIIGYLVLVTSIVLLAYTLLFGVVQQGAARFITFAGRQVQPSELAKMSLIIVLADQIERCQREEYKAKAFWWMICGIFVIGGMIFFENFSTAVILFMVTFIMMWIGEVNSKKLFAIMGVMIVAVGLIFFVAWKFPDNDISFLHRASTWVSRIDKYFEPKDMDFYMDDNNRQIVHSQIAIARGGFIPSGPGTSIERNYIPEAFSDFIFAIIVEEGGLIIGLFVIMLYMILLFRAGVVANKADSLFSAILVIGITLLIVIQAFIHVGVAVNLGPVTGQPLPLISRGGTSMIVNCIYFGIIIRITRSIQNKENIKQSTVSTGEEEKTDIEVDETSQTSDNAEEIKIIKK